MEEFGAQCGGLGLLLCGHELGLAPILVSGEVKSLWRFLLPLYRRTRAGKPSAMAFAITEPAAGSDVEEGTGAKAHKPEMVAKRVDGGWKLSGRKIFITNGDIAAATTMFAALEGEGMESWTCFFVRNDSPGFRVVRSELKMGQRASAAAELELEDVFVPDADIVGELRQGWALNRVSLNFSRMPVAAGALGIARGAVEAAIDFACRFKLGGKELIHYQEVQMQIAQMIAEITAIRGSIWQLALRITPTQAAASTAKFNSSDRAIAVSEAAMNLLGNHSLLHHNRVEKAFRDGRLNQIYEGANQINRLAVIEDLQEQFLVKIEAGKSR